MIFVSPMPGEQALEQYNANYFMSAHGGQPHDVISVTFFKAIARLRFAFIKNYLDQQKIKPATILEVGPGPGFFAEVWLNQYPDSRYLALESDASCYESLEKLGVQIKKGDSLSKEAEGSVDLIIMSHVLEHVSDPRSFLTGVTQKLRKGGALFIEVPCTDYLHKHIIEPHLLFFDKKAMRYLLEDLSFTQVQVSYHGEEISKLRNVSFFKKAYNALRSKAIGMGIIAPFAKKRPGMELMSDPLERAVVAPFKAHVESQQPSWWLRALAVKK